MRSLSGRSIHKLCTVSRAISKLCNGIIYNIDIVAIRTKLYFSFHGRDERTGMLPRETLDQFHTGGIRGYALPATGRKPVENEGMGVSYANDAGKCLMLDQYLSACQAARSGPQAMNIMPSTLDKCEKQVDCQREVIQASFYFGNGITLGQQFEACDSNTRNLAAQYLEQKYYWPPNEVKSQSEGNH